MFDMYKLELTLVLTTASSSGLSECPLCSRNCKQIGDSLKLSGWFLICYFFIADGHTHTFDLHHCHWLFRIYLVYVCGQCVYSQGWHLPPVRAKTGATHSFWACQVSKFSWTIMYCQVHVAHVADVLSLGLCLPVMNWVRKKSAAQYNRSVELIACADINPDCRTFIRANFQCSLDSDCLL